MRDRELKIIQDTLYMASEWVRSLADAGIPYKADARKVQCCFAIIRKDRGRLAARKKNIEASREKYRQFKEDLSTYEQNRM